MSAEPAVNFIDAFRRRAGKHRPGGRRLHHVDDDEMLAAQEINVIDEFRGEHRIVERRQEDEERATTKARPDEREKVLEIRRHDLRLESVERVAANVVMRLSIPGPNERLNAIAECEQTEEIALLGGGLTAGTTNVWED